MKRTWRFWSDEEVEILKKLWGNPKISIEDLKKVLNRSESSILNKAKNIGLPPRYEVLSFIDRDLLKKLLEVVEG